MTFEEAFSPSRAVRHGWEAFKRVPLPMWLGAFLVGLGQGGGGGGFNPAQFADLAGTGSDDTGGGLDLEGLFDNLRIFGLQVAEGVGFPLQGLGGGELGVLVGAMAGVICVALCCGLFLFLVTAWAFVGYLRLHRQILETGTGDFTSLFSGADRFLSMLLWMLLNAAIVLGTLLATLLPGGVMLGVGLALETTALMVGGGLLMAVVAVPALIYVSLGLTLGAYALVFEELEVMQALARSWSLAAGNRLHLFVYGLVLGLFAVVLTIAGLCMCLVGVLITGPMANGIVMFGTSEAFLLYTQGSEITREWRFWAEVEGA